MNKMKHYRRFLLLLALLSETTFGMAQTTFDPGEGCLNVIDVSYAQGVGEYGDGGIMASICDDAYLIKAFDTNKNDYRNKLINSLGISVSVFFQIKGW